MPQWKVKLAISGAVTTSETLKISVEKQTNYAPFMSTVDIRQAAYGLVMQLDVLAANIEEANEVAIYFVGQTLNVLCLHLELPLYLSFSGSQFRPIETNVKRVVSENEWENAFKTSNDYGNRRTTFGRALSWYRKGLTSDDPIDKLLAFWLSLEVIGSKFHRKNEKTNKGSKNQILDCFDQIWESSQKWKVIPGNVHWMDDLHSLRNDIAHGNVPVDIDLVKRVVQKVPKLQELASEFLLGWERYGSDYAGTIP